MTKIWIDETDIAGKEAIDTLKNKSFAQVIEDEEEEVDWWDTISPEERAAIDRGLKDVAERRTTPHEEVRKIYAKWL
ncbi:hypothetical protein EZS27_004782 [termite gut metagenome]|uniref:Addiction module component n=1 Tax=termite gut metagenome TaxID=433724 RepID=A0A5J4SP89_9ZZZZ